ncbi:hypothetical protein [Brevundimonas guildfordensis]|uniref:Uncharacterized protein n=1 Tax=Brevundimonas guildfordensis TaxID=2762241 RepID=A0ABR8R1M2_9CAUL|nr:hypothetical protein [Brevundimonas guildfordensis]MBD7941689.1 hypothetical protein [Brevundimonas guildfordensis]
MDIIERYLEAVAAQLPTDDREDIVAELRDLILSRVEAREEELGRALTDEEKEAILHEIGHPLIVAARYRKGPDSLIGPELFPYWLFGAKAGLTLIAAVQALGLLIHVLGAPADVGRAIGQAFHGFFSGALTLLGALTLAGAVMEHFNIKPTWLTKWRVRDLSAFGLADPAKWGASLAGSEKAKAEWLPKGARVWGVAVNDKPGVEALVSLIVAGVFVMWWIGVISFPGLGAVHLRGGAVGMEPAPVWAALYGPILALAVGGMAVDAITLIRGREGRLGWFLKIPLAGAALWVLWRLFEAGWWFTLTQGDATARVEGGAAQISLQALRAINEAGRDLGGTALTLGTVLTWVFAIMAISFAVNIVGYMWRIATAKAC